jgi:hypothetical protein
MLCLNSSAAATACEKAAKTSTTRYVACIGALITILSLAFSTFTQQLVAITSFPLTGGNNALSNLPWSEGWILFDGNPAESGEFPNIIVRNHLFIIVHDDIREKELSLCERKNYSTVL